MAIKINFDLANNPETPTLILATRDGNKLGQIEAKEIELSEKLIGASEITFIVNKYVDGKLTNLWDKIVDFKLVHCKEWDVWFEIRVEIDEDTKTVKTVFGTQLGQAELSQLMLYNIEINTETDISRDDYEISVLYDPDHPDASILHRLFEKAPHYSFGNVDGTVMGIQRSFSFDEVSIYDALQEIAEEIGCLFVFHSGTDINGKIERYISVHDLEQYCNDCGHRGEFTTVCSKCGSDNMRHGYGEDTTIFVTADELASNNIQFTTDTDSVKNCFKLEAGDDLMTATIRNCNPNGTDYIWYFSDSIKADMSQALKDKLESYDAMYKDYHDNYNAVLDASLLSKYNAIVNKYKVYNKDLENIISPIKGYSNLMNAYYNVIDLSLYLESGMMPTVTMSETNASAQAALLSPASLSPIAVTNIQYASVETVNSVALGMAKVLVKPTYKVEINGTSTLSDVTGATGAEQRTWRGSFTITNYSDEEDTATTGTIAVIVNGNAELFTKQKIEKALNKADTEDYSIVGLFERDLSSFKEKLKEYALKPLSSFRDACQACIDILIEQGATKDDLYDRLYRPYWDKLKAIEAEMKVREDEIAAIDGIYDEEGNLIKRGLATDIEKIKEDVQNALDFEGYLGADLWFEFSSYRREDKYKNENYISDGLNNAELFTRALEFIEVAENEIYKSAELQHSISSTLKNLMVIEKFEPFVDYFEVGNWMRVQLDDSVYKLRLLEYTIDFNNIEDISVVFSDISKVRNGISDLEDLFSQASSMTTHYDSVKKQANKGSEARGTIEQWLQDGLNSALVRINSNDSEEVSMTQNGILCRSYDSLTDSYSPKQLKLTHNIIAYTKDDWMHVQQAIGEHRYMVYDAKADNWVADIGYGMSADFVTSGYLTGATIVGGEIYSSNYSNGTGGSTTPMGTYINLQTGEFEIGGRKLVYNANDDKLTLSGVTIEWSNTNKPDITNISGFDDYINKLDAIETQVDNKAETWYQATDPSANWTTNDLKDEHIGDLWYYTGNTGTVNGTQRSKGSEWVWQKVGNVYQWCKIDVSDEVYNIINGKSSIYTSVPSNPKDGDLLIPSSNIGTSYLAGQVYKYNATTQTWVEISYATNTAVDTAQSTANAAKELGDKLVNVLGYDGTKITGTYIYSPVISGGSLLIGNQNGTYAQITTNGVLNASGANITGTIKSGYKTYDDGTGYNYGVGYNFSVSNGYVEMGLQSDGTYAMTVYPDGRIVLGKGVTLSWGDLGGTPDIPSGDSGGSGSDGGNTSNGEDTALRNALGYEYKYTSFGYQYVISPHIQGGYLYIGDSTNYAEIKNGILTAQGAVLHGSLYGDTVYDANRGTSHYSFKVENGYVYAGYNSTTGEYNFVVSPSGHVTIRGSLSIEGVGSGGSSEGGSSDVYWTDIKDKPDIYDRAGIVSIVEGTITADVVNAWGITAKYVTAGYLKNSTYVGTVYNANSAAGSFMDLNTGYFTFGGGGIKYDNSGLSIGSWLINEYGLHASEYFNGQNFVSSIYPHQGTSSEDKMNSTFIEAGIFTLSHMGNVRCNDINMLGDVFIDNGNITISARANNDVGDPDAFKVDRDMYFTAGNGLYDYDTGYNVIRLSENSKVFVGHESYEMVRLNGKTIYFNNSNVTTLSDRRLKTDISGFTDAHEDIFLSLKPVNFKYINGNSGRTHYGFIAQDVRDAAIQSGFTTRDIAAFVSIPMDDGNEEYALCYTEFVALNTHMIQKCLKEIDSLKSENSSLKQQLEEIKQAI